MVRIICAQNIDVCRPQSNHLICSLSLTSRIILSESVHIFGVIQLTKKHISVRPQNVASFMGGGNEG